MKHVKEATRDAVARAKLAGKVRELAEEAVGVRATVDLEPAKLARMLADLLDVDSRSPRISSDRRQRSLFGPDEDGRTYSFPIEGQRRIVLKGECLLLCPVCGGLRPLELRHMNDEEIRNQPRCGPCRKVKTT